ncbi:hypothetical protein [Xylanimonas sp. McL0601]|uniref:hypothetical protein n=1 Tax=Xylanimonas sp. McL0601 TaxID=3414739 RepID=UPI003CEB3F11
MERSFKTGVSMSARSALNQNVLARIFRAVAAAITMGALAVACLALGAAPASAADTQATTLTVTPHLPWWEGGVLDGDVMLTSADGARVYDKAWVYVDGVVRGWRGTSDGVELEWKSVAPGPHEVRVEFRGTDVYAPTEWVGTVEAQAPNVTTVVKAVLADTVPQETVIVPIHVTAPNGSLVQGGVLADVFASQGPTLPESRCAGTVQWAAINDGEGSVALELGYCPPGTAKLVVTFASGREFKPADFSKTITIGLPLAAPVPTIVGAPKVGATLTAQPGNWTAGAALTYQWSANGTTITGATGRAFTPRAAQVGKKITVTVTGSKPTYRDASKTSAATAAVASANVQLGYQGHVQNIGWQPWVTGGQIAGTTGRSLRVEALRFRLNSPAYAGGITASAHVQNVGWMAPVATGGVVGTQGRGLRVEAFTMQLTGEMAKHYDLYYRTHAQNFGWLGWAKNGARSGTAGYAYRLEAVDVRLVVKGDPAPSGTGLKAFYQR